MTSDQTQNQSPEPDVTDAKKDVLPPYLAFVGINEAARLVGKGKQQIYRDIETGKLSWHIEESGRKTLQIADLDRVYTLKSQAVTGHATSQQNRMLPVEKPSVTASQTVEAAVELAVLRAELRAKEEVLRRVEEEVRDLRQNRDTLLEQNNRLTMLLTAPPVPAEPAPSGADLVETPKTDSPPRRKSLWERLFS